MALEKFSMLKGECTVFKLEIALVFLLGESFHLINLICIPLKFDPL
jgi:hypothetical protein